LNPDGWRLRTRLPAAALSGGLLLLAFPPVDAGWVALGALVPLALALRGASGRAGLATGAVFSVVFFGGLIWWISLFGFLAWGALVVRETMFLAAFGWFGAWAARSGVGRVAGLPLIYTALEVLRTRWPLGGFAWGGLGYTQHDAGSMLPLARIGGVHLITLGIVAINALAAAAIVRGGFGRRVLALLAAAGIAAGPLALPLGLAGPTGERLDVAIVQGNVREGTFTGFADRVGREGPEDFDILDNHVQATLPLAADQPDLVIWPENALDRDPLANPEVGAIIEQTVQTVGAPFIVGAILDVPGRGFRNSNLLYGRDGRVVATYDKMHLVPFGEYVPWPRLRRYIKALEQIPEDGVPGTSPVVFDIGDAKVGAVICFESTYPQLVRSFVDLDAELLVVSTNNASFRRSPAARQHVQMSKLRAVENGRVVLHAAISGITAVIDARGQVLRQTRLFEPALVRTEVPLARGRTPYGEYGGAIELGIGGLGAAAALVGAARIVARRRARRYDEAEMELWGEPEQAPHEEGAST
jgi:apolipoprotein N-acyltransferase